jgi:peptidoglycan hydrolase CwlO-like protein
VTEEPVKPVTVETNGISEHTVVIEDQSSKKFYVFPRRFVHIVLGGFVATLTIGAVAFFLMFRDQQDIISTGQVSIENLTADLDKLREQLGDAQRQLNTARAASDELTACRNTYSTEVSEATSDILVEQTQLIAAIAGPDDAAVDQAIAEIEAAGVALLEAQEARQTWEQDGNPLPCPIHE